MPAFTVEQNKALARMLTEWADSIEEGKAKYVADAMRSAAKGCLRNATEVEELDQVFNQNAKFVNREVLKCTAKSAELRRNLLQFLAQHSALNVVASQNQKQSIMT